MDIKGFPVVLLNGPPRSGKDFAASAICAAFSGAAVLKLAGPLKRATHEAFGLADAPHDAYEDCKDVPHEDFGGLTPRAAYIAMSEQGIKLAFGTRHFGSTLARRIDRMRLSRTGCMAVVSDSGFADETAAIAEAVGRASVLLLRLSRAGCSFAGDSRSYISLPGVVAVDIHNCGTPAFAERVVGYVRSWSWTRP